MSVWDDPDLKVNDDYVSFKDVGDTVTGTVVTVRRHTFEDGKAVPQIIVATTDGEEKTITAGQVRLKALLAEQRPEAGDVLTVTLSSIEPRAGGKTLKHFDVNVVRGNDPVAAVVAAPATPAPSQAAPVADPQAAAAALANLTPEQKTALGIG